MNNYNDIEVHVHLTLSLLHIHVHVHVHIFFLFMWDDESRFLEVRGTFFSIVIVCCSCDHLCVAMLSLSSKSVNENDP